MINKKKSGLGALLEVRPVRRGEATKPDVGVLLSPLSAHAKYRTIRIPVANIAGHNGARVNVYGKPPRFVMTKAPRPVMGRLSGHQYEDIFGRTIVCR